MGFRWPVKRSAFVFRIRFVGCLPSLVISIVASVLLTVALNVCLSGGGH
jgi:hypothetical protein